MDQKKLRQLEDQCIQDCAPPCTASCPAHVDVRAILKHITECNYPAALQKFGNSVLFPEIIARTCDQPCQSKCNRESLGGVIEVRRLELACTSFGGDFNYKFNYIPKKNARVAVIGGGLCGMSAAIELGKKGYLVSLFEEQSKLGGRLWQFSRDHLPEGVIIREVGLVSQTNCAILYESHVTDEMLSSGSFDAFFLATGQGSLGGFPSITSIDNETFQTNLNNVFAGGSLLYPPSSIHSVSGGRRVAISIDRYLQNVSLTASRVNEGSYESCLFTNLTEISSEGVVTPADLKTGYTQIESVQEAARCLQCECMECVKVCEYLKQYGSYPKKYVREIYNNLTIIMRARTSNKFINSCTLCGLCKEVCPTDLSMADVIKDARQTMVKTKKMPPSAHDFALRDMAFSNSGKATVTLNGSGNLTCDYVFFPGCQLAASDPDYVLQAYLTLNQVYPGLGIVLRCCGAPAEWSGEEEIFSESVHEFTHEWESLGKPVLVLACASCNKILTEAIPGVKTISIWEVFNKLDQYPERDDVTQEYVIHDPCSSRHEDKWQEAVRQALQKMGVPFHELELSREKPPAAGMEG